MTAAQKLLLPLKEPVSVPETQELESKFRLLQRKSYSASAAAEASSKRTSNHGTARADGNAISFLKGSRAIAIARERVATAKRRSNS